MKVLVVFYSRTGHTREVGHRIAAALHADMEEIADRVNRRGIRGYFRSAREAWLRHRTPIAPLAHAPGAYDLVVVGTPVWSMSLSSPLRTFLHDERAKLRDVAFFCTMGGLGDERVFRQMEEEVGKHPIAVLAIRERDLEGEGPSQAIRRFASELRALRYAA